MPESPEHSGFRCPAWYDADGNGSNYEVPGFVRCCGRTIVNDNDEFDDEHNMWVRWRQCRRCGCKFRTHEKQQGPIRFSAKSIDTGNSSEANSVFAIASGDLPGQRYLWDE